MSASVQSGRRENGDDMASVGMDNDEACSSDDSET